tara:strand:+ start:22113 stop:23429 length:1317 start_codon:yes stop_codon:yes gene_type:complete
LLNIEEEDVKISADPLFNFSVSKYNQDFEFRYYSNVRGFRVKADIGPKISFETRFYENQFFYPDYLLKRAKQRASPFPDIDGIAIGIGRAKFFKNDQYPSKAYDAGLANGYLSFSPSKSINFQLGHGRHFFGNGYRSLLLSDYAPDYAYLSGQYIMNDGKIMYRHVNGWMNTLDRIPYSSTPEALFKPKVSNFNMLSFHPNEQFQFSFFEGLIYKKYDRFQGVIRPEIGFFIPIIGKGLIMSDSSSTNLIYGVNLSYNPFNNLMFYNQLALQSENRIGAQIGVKWTNFLNMKNSFICLEYNRVASDLYAMDSSNYIQNYSHLSHELAHPLGSGFNEVLIKGLLEYKNYFLRFGGNYANVDYHSDIGWANNIMNTLETLPNPESKVKLMIMSSSLGYRFNKATRMELSLGFLYRKQDVLSESYFTFTWRTFLKNNYFDQ